MFTPYFFPVHLSSSGRVPTQVTSPSGSGTLPPR